MFWYTSFNDRDVLTNKILINYESINHIFSIFNTEHLLKPAVVPSVSVSLFCS